MQFSLHDNASGGAVIAGTGLTPPGSTWTFIQKQDIDLLPIHDGENFEVRAEAFGSTGSVWFDDVQLVEQLPWPISAFLLYPNFRGYLWGNGPQTIKLQVDVGVTNLSNLNVQSTLQADGGSTITTITQPAMASQELDFDGSSLASGKYLLTTALVDSAGNTVSTFPAYRIIKTDPSFQRTLVNYIDTDNFLVRKGQKRFVWGVYDRWGNVRCTTCLFNNTNQYLTQIAGFNGVSTLQNYKDTMVNAEMSILPFAGVHIDSSNDQMTPWLDAADSQGVGHVQLTVSWFQGKKYRPAWARGIDDQQLWQMAANVMNGKPGALGYYPYDEPDTSSIPSVYAQYNVLKQFNPGGITWGTLRTPHPVFRWRDVSDVLSADPYPIGMPPNYDDLSYGATTSPPMLRTSAWTRATVQEVYGHRPVWMVLQQFLISGQFPDYNQMKMQAYKAIINGATGIMWWGFVSDLGIEQEWFFLKNHQPYFDFQRLSQEVMALEPVLISPPRTDLVAAVSDSRIEYLVKADASKIVVFASNFTESSLGNVTFTLSPTATTTSTPVQVYSESRSVPLSAAPAFVDTFGPYEVHVYTINLN